VANLRGVVHQPPRGTIRVARRRFFIHPFGRARDLANRLAEVGIGDAAGAEGVFRPAVQPGGIAVIGRRTIVSGSSVPIRSGHRWGSIFFTSLSSPSGG
jgi:hypothetical protein